MAEKSPPTATECWWCGEQTDDAEGDGFVFTIDTVDHEYHYTCFDCAAGDRSATPLVL